MTKSEMMFVGVAVLAGPTPLNSLSISIYLKFIRHEAEIIAGLALCFVDRGGAEALFGHLAYGYVKIICAWWRSRSQAGSARFQTAHCSLGGMTSGMGAGAGQRETQRPPIVSFLMLASI